MVVGWTPSPSSSSSSSCSSVGSCSPPSMELEMHRSPADLNQRKTFAWERESEERKEEREDEEETGRDLVLVLGGIFSGDVELGPSTNHGRRPLLIQGLLL